MYAPNVKPEINMNAFPTITLGLGIEIELINKNTRVAFTVFWRLPQSHHGPHTNLMESLLQMLYVPKIETEQISNKSIFHVFNFLTSMFVLKYAPII